MCNPNTQEVEAGGLQVPDQPELQNKTVSKKKKNALRAGGVAWR
jgi:hypothetical protein